MISSQVGLAVGDTEAMKKFATVKRLAMQIEYQIEIEEAFPRFLTRAVYETVYVEKPNKLSKYYRYGVNSNCCCNQSLKYHEWSTTFPASLSSASPRRWDMVAAGHVTTCDTKFFPRGRVNEYFLSLSTGGLWSVY